MRKEPFLRNENPEEIREIIFKCVSKIRENQSDREIHKDVLFELGLLEGRIDQKNLKVDVEIDGGINFKNCAQAKDAGANILVSGSTVFNENNGDLKKNIEVLRNN